MSKARDVADSYTDVEVDAKDATLQTQVNDKVGTTSNQALHSTDALRLSGTTLYIYKGNGTSESVTLPSSVPTAAQVGSATAGLNVGEVGTYAYLVDEINSRATNPGTLRPGSNLRYFGHSVNEVSSNFSGNYFRVYGTGATGTWRCMGYSSNHDSGNNGATIWLRIS
jgi:hypothetical protein